jgi:hypothetical protein
MSDIFPPRPDVNPRIYAYSENNPNYAGLLKVGYTTRNVADRVAEQYPIGRPGDRPYTIVLDEPAMRDNGTSFTDHDIHRVLRRRGFHNPKGEWFRCAPADVKRAVVAVRDNTDYDCIERTESFSMRREQQEAVEKTVAYFKDFVSEGSDGAPHFLWNAKMRFGKTFTAYQLAKRMGFRRILVLTFKPAVRNAWRDDLMMHRDFEGWQFVSRDGVRYADADKSRPIVCFGSFQDFLGKNKVGGIGPKEKNTWAHEIQWDLVVFDEYHYGAWRDNAKDLFEGEDKSESMFGMGDGLEYFKEDYLPIRTSHYLYLSGTPFRAIASGEFIEEQIYNWTYSDEQKAKTSFEGEDNPYEMMPRMVLMTYKMPPSVTQVALGGEFDEFDLNEFFYAEGAGEKATFKHQDEVQKWLDIIRGASMETTIDSLRLGAKKPPMPYSDSRLLRVLNHTFWYLPSVASCHAMSNLLKQRNNTIFHDYEVNVCAGAGAGMGVCALEPVERSMADPLNSKTITLSCGKLTTGVTVKPWAGILVLRNLQSPESYFQAAFRVQSPWTLKNPDGLSPNKTEVLKKEVYVFDFAPNRALKQIADYSCRLNLKESNPEKNVQEFIKFLPILAYDGSAMQEINAEGVLQYAMSGTTATLLARRWESALLVNVDNNTLARLMDDKEAMDALMSIEGFRNLNEVIETIINKSESVKDLKREANNRDLSKREKRKLSAEEKEYKSKRKEIQEKLIKFVTRIPVFMYMTDYREHSLIDIIRHIEPELFKKVTGLNINDFERLLSLGLFNSALMNDAVYKFKRYEDSSLQYTGIIMHKSDKIGLFNTVIGTYEVEHG